MPLPPKILPGLPPGLHVEPEDHLRWERGPSWQREPILPTPMPRTPPELPKSYFPDDLSPKNCVRCGMFFCNCSR